MITPARPARRFLRHQYADEEIAEDGNLGEDSWDTHETESNHRNGPTTYWPDPTASTH